MKERFEKLLCIKSIVTIAMTGVFVYLCVTHSISAEQFMTIFATVVAFYFGTQAEKKSEPISISKISNEVNK